LNIAQLYKGTITQTNTDVTIYTVPSGSKVLVKEIRIHNASTATGDVRVKINTILIHQETVSSKSTLAISMNLVLEEGDSIVIYTPMQPLNIIASGVVF